MASRKTNKTTESFMSKGTDPRKKPKTQSSLALTFGNNAFLLASLRKTHIGKRILLRAKDMYNGTVPHGEEAFLFQYSVSHVNADCKTAIIDFDEKCIVEKGDMFQNYPNFGDEDTLAMLASIVHTVYIDDALVAAEYLRRCKAGSWKKENTVEAVKCWNLERIIDAELRGESMPEEEITMNDLVNEDNACIN